jgi:hypothetical protein
MTEVGDTATPAAQINGPASGATCAPELGPLSLEPRPASKPPIELLPNELLSNIFEFLDSPKPSSSESVIHDEPILELTRSDNAPLKAASYVSKRWRIGTIPLLFKHTQFIIKEASQAPYNSLDRMIKPFLEFVIEHQLRRTAQSFTLIVRAKEPANIIDRQERLFCSPTFWSGLFKVIDPQELLIVAPAEALGILTNCRTYMEDAWSFHSPYHYLRLQIRSKSPTGAVKVPQAKHKSINESIQNQRVDRSSSHVAEEKPRELNLWGIRPWTTLLLNEGSFIRAYASYEFWLRQPPSVSLNVTIIHPKTNNLLRFYRIS